MGSVPRQNLRRLRFEAYQLLNPRQRREIGLTLAQAVSSHRRLWSQSKERVHSGRRVP
jgi:hypothetical protein